MSPAPATVKSKTPVQDKDEWRTDPVLFELLNNEFRFQVDVAATDENALCRFYYTEQENALIQPWYDPPITRVFCNPPFSMLGEFLQKGREEALRGATSVFIARGDGPETRWFTEGILDLERPDRYSKRHLYKTAVEVRNLTPRAKYIRPDGVTVVNGVLFPTSVIIMGPNIRPNVFWWYWKKHADELGLNRNELLDHE